MPRKIIPPSDDFIALYRKGLAYAEIGRILQMHLSTVSRYAEKTVALGIQRDSTDGELSETEQAVLDMSTKRVCIMEIGETLDLSRDEVISIRRSLWARGHKFDSFHSEPRLERPLAEQSASRFPDLDYNGRRYEDVTIKHKLEAR